MQKRFFIGLWAWGLLLLSWSCKDRHADLLLVNGIVHTMDSLETVAQAVAIEDGRIVAVGRTNDLQFDFEVDSVVDLRGKPVYPGFIDAHCHFYDYALSRDQLSLRGTTDWEEVLLLVEAFAEEHPEGWLIGRGWDQNDWTEQEFPTNRGLNRLFPERPVLLYRVDGHAAVANAAALELAGITGGTRVEGGKVLRRGRRPTGVLIENAVDLVEEVLPVPEVARTVALLKEAEEAMFEVGLTTLDDAGLDLAEIELIDSLQAAGELRIRIYAMAQPTKENLDRFLEEGPYQTERLHVRSFKVTADGALGSRGACLLSPYKDAPGKRGFLLHEEFYYRDLAERIYAAGLQMNTQCVGDSANRMMLRIYGETLGEASDARWRIEHAQVVAEEDFARFGEIGVWPSVQPSHATSDMYWAEDRIGKERLKGAYAYRRLFAQNGKIAFGSKFPVEDINPILGFYAAVARKDLTDYPYGGFEVEEAVGRDTALKAMTLWAAEANFEEQEKGSVEVGKMADLVVLDRDILYSELGQVPYTQVLMTLLGGEVVYGDGGF